MGLVTLTHTPSPMRFLSILNRPTNERPFVLFPVGYPAEDATVSDIRRKPLAAISAGHEPPPAREPEWPPIRTPDSSQ